MNSINDIKQYLCQLQQQIAQSLAATDGQANFTQHPWQGKDQSEGSTWVIENGQVFEKGAINFSHVYGKCLPAAASAKRSDLAGKPFQALGVSLIMHPQNPFVPTTHFNVRFFTTIEENARWWFGGGYDLTPTYGFVEDCHHWHKVAAKACQPFGNDLYPRFKQWCDEYFFLKHRNEARGIGGLFFDDVNNGDFEQDFAFTRAIGDSFVPAYVPLVEKRKSMPFQAHHKAFQCYRRGRYVEFNLVYDRGTLFGLQYGGRTESILCSMPPQASWRYDWQPDRNTPEAELYEQFLPARDWLSSSD